MQPSPSSAVSLGNEEANTSCCAQGNGQAEENATDTASPTRSCSNSGNREDVSRAYEAPSSSQNSTSMHQSAPNACLSPRLHQQTNHYLQQTSTPPTSRTVTKQPQAAISPTRNPFFYESVVKSATFAVKIQGPPGMEHEIGKFRLFVVVELSRSDLLMQVRSSLCQLKS
jgi:hypothetical protein